MCALQMKMSWLYFGVKPVWPSSLFSTPLFLLEGQVLLFVSVYDLFITSRCQKQHRCNVSCDGNVLNSGSKPARSSSFPPTRLHSVPALDFPDKSTLLYLMSSRSTFYLFPTLQIVTLTCMHFFQKVFKSKGQRMSNSACDQWWSICYVQDIFKISHFTSQRGSTLFFAGHPPIL